MRAVAAEVMPVVASFSILADLTAQVGGKHVHVDQLAGADADMHVYQPTPSDIRRIKSAKVLVVNGLGFEGWLGPWIEKNNSDSPLVVVASRGISAISSVPDGTHGHAHEVDPHAWHSIPNVMRYVDNIAAGLIKADPRHAAEYRKNATEYKRQLKALDDRLIAQFAALPPDRRKVITSHDAFQYFAKRYGLTCIALQGMNAESEPSAAAVAAVIQQVRQSGIRALFVENISNPRLLQQISKETEVTIGGRLYSDALSGSDGPVPTYLKMMQYNADQLIRALSTYPRQ